MGADPGFAEGQRRGERGLFSFRPTDYMRHESEEASVNDRHPDITEHHHRG